MIVEGERWTRRKEVRGGKRVKVEKARRSKERRGGRSDEEEDWTRRKEDERVTRRAKK